MRRRILSLAVSLTLLLPMGLTPFGAGAATPAASNEAAPVAAAESSLATLAVAPSAQVPAGFEPVADTASLRLHINRDDSKLIVEDKRSGKLWTSNPLTPISDQPTILDNAVFQLNYTNARRQMTNLASSASERPNLTFQNIPNGVRVLYDIPKLLLKITIDYAIKEQQRLDGGGTLAYLEVTVPDGGVQEGGDCSAPNSPQCFMITSLELLPLFGAAPLGAEGYLMVPDESGAIVTFKHEYPQYRQRFSGAVFGADAGAQAFDTGRGGAFFASRPRMPLWGLATNDGPAAYAGIITKGEFQANINAYLAGYITNANRASTEFIYRRQASIPRRRTLMVNRIEDDQIPGERQVRYVLLNGQDANYAGMAKAYREHLMTDKGLKRLPAQQPRQQVDLYLGALQRKAFNDDFVPMTTFDQARQIIQEFLNRGMRDFDVQLIGWNDGGERGYWPRRYPAEDELGGNSGLQQLTKFAHDNGVRIYLQDNYLFGFTISTGGIFGQLPFIRELWPTWSYGFNSRFDTMRGVNKLPIFSQGPSGSGGQLGQYLLNPVVAHQRYVDRDYPTHKRLGADGVSLAFFGNFAASDTNEFYPLSRDQVVEQWMKMADKSREQLGAAMVLGPNAYVLGHTDRVLDAPVDSRDAFGDTPVPVYHIATHGLVMRHTHRVNLRNDPKTEILRQIEWGMFPVYQLTWQPSSDLIRAFTWLYSSQFKDWVEPASQEYKMMRDQFGPLASQFMTNHEILAWRVYRVTYEDGTQVLVNYNPEPYDGPAGRIDPFGYVVRKGGAS
ncbi:MAG TPA: DUF5696 domain-containing protein [Chloroflexota bacterium]|nr:DUF5696 domain-containing protein [Chloroflexota bacterium]